MIEKDIFMQRGGNIDGNIERKERGRKRNQNKTVMIEDLRVSLK